MKKVFEKIDKLHHKSYNVIKMFLSMFLTLSLIIFFIEEELSVEFDSSKNIFSDGHLSYLILSIFNILAASTLVIFFTHSNANMNDPGTRRIFVVRLLCIWFILFYLILQFILDIAYLNNKYGDYDTFNQVLGGVGIVAIIAACTISCIQIKKFILHSHENNNKK